jgi:hypothetical protein
MEGLTYNKLSMCSQKSRGIETDLIGDLEDLCLFTGLRALEGGFDAVENFLGEGSGTGDGDRYLTLVLGNKLVEALNDTLSLVQPAVLGQKRQEVFANVGQGLFFGLELREELGKACSTLLSGEGGVVDEGGDILVTGHGSGDGIELRLDLGQSLGGLCEGSLINGIGIFESDGRGSTLAETRSRRGNPRCGCEQH